MIETPYFHLCPRDPKANLEWRLKLRRAALHDLEARAAIKQACFDDPLFFISFACWLIEPRGNKRILPFCVWDMQIPAIEVLVECVTNASDDNPIDVIFDKSRGRGATWMCLAILLWYWLKDELFAGGIISRNMEAVDKRNDLGKLMPKLDWLIPRIPFWLRPKGFFPKRDRSLTDHVWHNCELGGVLAGTACTGEAFSGDRLSVLFYDEAAKVDHEDFQDAMDSTQNVTDARWIVSSHFGESGPFHDMVFNEEWIPSGKIFPLGGSGVYRNSSGAIKVVLDWKDYPPHGRLAYRFLNGVPKAVNPEDDAELAEYVKANAVNLARLKRRGFIKEGRIRSPWLDRKCLQPRATPRGIAQDIERDPRSTVGKIFTSEIMDMVAKNIRPPCWQGDVTVRNGIPHFIQQDEGPLKFWTKFDLKEGLPKGRYCFGVDPGSGVENSKSGVSTIVGGDASTGEQVMEWNRQLSEARLADLAVALCTWAGDAMLIWEAQGACGKLFATRVMDELHYWNIWVRKGYKRHGQTAKPDMFGWNNNTPRHKIDLFGDLCFGMDDKEFIPFSEELIAECRGWEEDDKGQIIYKGTGHGDRAIAAGVCYKAMKEMGVSAIDKKTDNCNSEGSELSIFGRMNRRKALESSRKNDIFAGFRRGLKGSFR
ncbi:hypothetical protein M0R72_18180 [Candidatus Pacearchaeota archaeon]|jgi:hypothetical protein|nr:hypothetical protein [Candidatus Pacearchaeota archaeon]